MAEDDAQTLSVAERAVLADLRRHAPSFAPLVANDRALTQDILSGPLERAADLSTLRSQLRARLERGESLTRAIRRLRHRTLLRVVLREVRNLADLDQTAAELSALASICLDAAMSDARQRLTAEHGDAVDDAGRPIPLVALGMGKLGGWELNLGSDIDLVFFYETDDAVVQGGELTPHELLTKVVRAATRTLTKVTEDGFAFRVDLRLRPEGSRGPLVNSLGSAERYYVSVGRSWERAALLRARPVAGDLAFGEELLAALRPWVFRRQVEPEIAASMHRMVERARRDLGADPERNIKLGRGGIRELEFFIQALQLVWGGRHPELQVTGTIEAIRRLRSAGLLPDVDARDLEAAWAMLRRVEHRIQMIAGYQTHDLPDDPTQLAQSLGFRGAEELDGALGDVRAGVALTFDTLVGDGPDPVDELYQVALDAAEQGTPSAVLVGAVDACLPVRDPHEAASHLARAARRATSPFGPRGRLERPHLAPMLLHEISQAADPDAALRGAIELLLRSGEGYHGILEAEPRLTRRLISLFGASRTLGQALCSHPEGLSEVLLHGHAPGGEEIARSHEALAPLLLGEEQDVEAFVRTLRRVKRELTLRVGLAHVDGELVSRGVQRRLTRIADAQVRAALAFARRELIRRHGAPVGAALAVVGMGKLGGEELGYGSDLDLMFLYSTDGETTPPPGATSITYAELFTRIAQRTMRLLSAPDAEGDGYEIDARLRPSGSQGLLVVAEEAFGRYHRTRAQDWERQALVRSRVVACDDATFSEWVGVLLERTAYKRGPTSPATLTCLRRRMQRELARESSRRYDPKLGFGGIADVEFLTQWLQMRHADDQNVRQRHTLDALQALRKGGYIDPLVEATLQEGYGFFRAAEQALRLFDDKMDAVLVPRGPRATALARRLRLRARDGMSAEESLEGEWRRRAKAVRDVFESFLGAVDAPSPWTSRPR